MTCDLREVSLTICSLRPVGPDSVIAEKEGVSKLDAIEMAERAQPSPWAGRTRRRGATAVEFAVVSLVFFPLVFGLIEFGRMAMCFQVMTNAVREGARVGILPSSTSTDVVDEVNTVLAGGTVTGVTVTVEPADISVLTQGQDFTVNAQVAFDDVSWLPVPGWLGNRLLQTSCTMVREGN